MDPPFTDLQLGVEFQLGLKKSQGTPFSSPAPRSPVLRMRPNSGIMTTPVPLRNSNSNSNLNSPSLYTNDLLNDLYLSNNSTMLGGLSRHNSPIRTRFLNSQMTPYTHNKFNTNLDFNRMFHNDDDNDNDDNNDVDNDSDIKNDKKKNIKKKRKHNPTLTEVNISKKLKTKEKKKEKKQKKELKKHIDRVEFISNKHKINRIVQTDSKNVKLVKIVSYTPGMTDEYTILPNMSAFAGLVANKKNITQALSNQSSRSGSMGQAGAIKISKSVYGRLKDIEFTPVVQKEYMDHKKKKTPHDILSNSFKDRSADKYKKIGIDDDEDFDTAMFTTGLTSPDVFSSLLLNYTKYCDVNKVSRNWSTYEKYAMSCRSDCDFTHKMISNAIDMLRPFSNMMEEIPEAKKPFCHVKEDGYEMIPYIKNLKGFTSNDDEEE